MVDMPDTEEKTYTPEQMAFAGELAERMEQIPDEQRPTVRALISAFMTGAEAMCSVSSTPEQPESDGNGATK